MGRRANWRIGGELAIGLDPLVLTETHSKKQHLQVHCTPEKQKLPSLATHVDGLFATSLLVDLNFSFSSDHVMEKSPCLMLACLSPPSPIPAGRELSSGPKPWTIN